MNRRKINVDQLHPPPSSPCLCWRIVFVSVRSLNYNIDDCRHHEVTYFICWTWNKLHLRSILFILDWSCMLNWWIVSYVILKLSDTIVCCILELCCTGMYLKSFMLFVVTYMVSVSVVLNISRFGYLPLWSSGQKFLATDPEVSRLVPGPTRFSENRCPLSLMRTIEELLEWKSSGSGLENRD
jgi:hypothetical protein